MIPQSAADGLVQREARMIKLKKPIADRERISTAKFPIPTRELLAVTLWVGVMAATAAGKDIKAA